jgi:ABC-type antimicrobial peptide transport system permease subunit
MTPIPLRYAWRSLSQRAPTTLLTAAGIGLAVFVVAALLMVSAGITQALKDSGSPRNAVFVRQPATSESRSSISRDDAGAVGTLTGIARGANGERLAAREVVIPVGVSLEPRRRGVPVLLRGTSATGLALRAHASLADGRMFQPSTDELVLGAKVQALLGLPPGAALTLGGHSWRIAGVFASSNTALDNEIWGDVDRVMAAFRRTHYSSVLARLDDVDALPLLARALTVDLRSDLVVVIERDFYAAQALALTRFLATFTLLMGAVFAAGATAAGMITMHASVAHRTREIGTLRALGFERGSILIAVLGEAAAIGLGGGGAGLLLAGALRDHGFTTLNIETSSNLSFVLHLSPTVALIALGFALSLGLAGGVLPAWRATRLRVCDALREAG